MGGLNKVLVVGAGAHSGSANLCERDFEEITRRAREIRECFSDADSVVVIASESPLAKETASIIAERFRAKPIVDHKLGLDVIGPEYHYIREVIEANEEKGIDVLIFVLVTNTVRFILSDLGDLFGIEVDNRPLEACEAVSFDLKEKCVGSLGQSVIFR